MSDITQGVYLRSASPPLRRAVELLSSMRFAISLLTVICIASVIGTVLKQHEPIGNYVNQFGPFWSEVFFKLQLNAVYSAWWFLLILAFLVTSTSLCIARNTPKIIADLGTYKENIREQNLRAFHLKAEADLGADSAAEAQRIGKMLAGGGWKVKLQQRDTAAGPGTGWMVAAKTGAAGKLGYIAAHSAIVLVCLGGLLDGDMVVRAQMWLTGKTPYAGGGLISEVSPEHWLSERNPAFRGNLVVSEGTQSSTAILSQSDGVVLQPLPFTLELKKFVVEYYSTGMPKLFASDVILHDLATGETQSARVEVNHPASFMGIEIYQSSFDDGGSRVKLSAIPLGQGGAPFEVDGVVGGKSQLLKGIGGQQLSIEFTGLRTINVENFGDDGASGTGSGADVRKVNLRSTLDSHLGAPNNAAQTKELRNVGPSISYKLRDAAGQAREYNNYMLPVDMGKGTVPVFLLGVREDPAQPFRYLRAPADDSGSIDGFIRLRHALADPKARDEAVARYVKQAVAPGRTELAAQLQQSAGRALTLFAGTGEPADQATGNFHGGLPAISKFMEDNVPVAERSRAGEVLVRILNGTLFELEQLTREQAGLAPLKADQSTLEFMTQAVLALSDVQAYPAPLIFVPKDFTQVQASVFQVSRSPGKKVVFLGCGLLILGVFSMLFIRERRLWVWLVPEGSGSHAMMALSTNRKTMDGDREFARLTEKLIGASPTGDKA